MIKNVMRGFAAVAVAVTVATFAVVPKANAAIMLDACKDKVLRPGSTNLVCNMMGYALLNDAKKLYGQSSNPAWPKLDPNRDANGNYIFVYNTAMKNAVIAYQFSNRAQGDSISVDGILGPQTWTYMIFDCLHFWPMQITAAGKFYNTDYGYKSAVYCDTTPDV